jgi:Rod binding domain-containing protein
MAGLVDGLGGAASGAAAAREQARLTRAVQEFEAILLTHMLRLARASWTRPAPTPAGAPPSLYRDLLDEELGRAVARSGGLGLGRVLLRELLRAAGSSAAPDRPIPLNRDHPAGGRP